MKPYFVLIVYMNIFYKLLQLFAPIIYNIYAIYSTFDLDIALNLTELRDVKLFTNLRASNIIKNKKNNNKRINCPPDVFEHITR